MTAPLLIVGAEGTLGRGLLDRCQLDGVSVWATKQDPEPDLPQVQRLDLNEPLDGWAPPACQAAVLCAAVTSIEACRRDPVGTRHVNVTQTLAVAERLVRAGTFVVFLSSNLVFDGTQPRRPAEDELCPMTEYGRQKAEVERALARYGDAVAIVRLTKVVGPHWTLLRGWGKALREGRTVGAFEDMRCAPIALTTTVTGLLSVAQGRLAGVWHFSAPGDVAYVQIARHLAAASGAKPELVHATRAADRVLEAAGELEHVPQHTTLDTSGTVAALGLCFPPPLDVVAACFGDGGTR